MRLAIFGATGGTGVELTSQALRRGHEVVALARRPEAVRIDHPRLRVIAGDVTVPGAADSVVEGADAVLSALGIGYHRYATTVYSAGIANLLAAMGWAGTGRVLVVSTSSLTLPGRDRLAEWLLARFVLHPMLRRPYADMLLMERLLAESAADWTVVRAARLTNGKFTGTWRVAEAGQLPGCWSISRADLATYLLDHVTDDSLARTTVEIAYLRQFEEPDTGVGRHGGLPAGGVRQTTGVDPPRTHRQVAVGLPYRGPERMQCSASHRRGQDLIEFAVGCGLPFGHVVDAFGGDEGAGDRSGGVVHVDEGKVRVLRPVEGLPPPRRHLQDLVGPGVAGPIGLRDTEDHAVTTASGVVNRQPLGRGHVLGGVG